MQSTTKQRLQYAIWRVFPGGWLAIGLGAIAAAFTPFVTEGPRWPMAALAALCVALPFAYGAVEFAMGGRKRQVGPLQVIAHPGTDVDLDSWAMFYDTSWWAKRWRAVAKRNGWTRKWLHRGGTVEFTAEAPSTGWFDTDGDSGAPDVDESREGLQKHGIHYADQRRIKVHAAESKGPVCHHELDLLAAHVIWPGQNEPEDIESLKGLGVR